MLRCGKYIIVSITKTTVLIFTKRNTPECDNFYYGDSVIENYKYFGFVHSTKYPKNVLKEMFLHLASQADNAVFSLHK